MAVQRDHPYYRVRRSLNWVIRRFSPIGPSSAIAIWSRWLSGVATYIGMLALTLLPFADAGERDVPVPIQPIAAWAFSHRFMIACLILLVSTLVSVLNGLIQRLSPFDVEKMREILDAAVAYHFVDQIRGEFQYRATLFKVCTFWPFGSWLSIVCRSGENYHQSNTILSCDRMNQKRCTGIAGECAWQKAIQICTIPHNTKTELEPYAIKGFLAEPERTMFNIRSLVFFAVPIDRQDGKLWGVLVLDSTDSSMSVDSDEKKEQQREATGHWALAIKTAIH